MSDIKSVNLNELAEQIIEIATKYGLEQNFFFLTTFNRYKMQIKILNDLQKTIIEEGNLVTKEYVKGRQNVYTHPAISEYNKTSTAANQTVQTLIKIITTLRADADGEEEDELLAFFRGHK
nr:MAG TPA: terminase small subunit [Caudoviricetes sp.]DAK04925.1 MAG TPA: terminase small subunit [Caudoviricetes sp.]